MVLLRKKIVDTILSLSRGQEDGVSEREVYSIIFAQYGITRRTFREILNDMIFAKLIDQQTFMEWGVVKVSEQMSEV